MQTRELIAALLFAGDRAERGLAVARCHPRVLGLALGDGLIDLLIGEGGVVTPKGLEWFKEGINENNT